MELHEKEKLAGVYKTKHASVGLFRLNTSLNLRDVARFESRISLSPSNVNVLKSQNKVSLQTIASHRITSPREERKL